MEPVLQWTKMYCLTIPQRPLGYSLPWSTLHPRWQAHLGQRVPQRSRASDPAKFKLVETLQPHNCQSICSPKPAQANFLPFQLPVHQEKTLSSSSPLPNNLLLTIMAPDANGWYHSSGKDTKTRIQICCGKHLDQSQLQGQAYTTPYSPSYVLSGTGRYHVLCKFLQAPV